MSGDKTSGNTLALQLVVDGMKLQPCSPTFVSARDAILQAEKVATGGKHQCALWAAFAKRGVGKNAKSGRPVVGDFTVPDECKSEITDEPKPTEPKPEEPKPTEPKPEEPKPTEPKPTEPAPTSA
jgi:extracellular elastinolytic metalloproteinase